MTASLFRVTVLIAALTATACGDGGRSPDASADAAMDGDAPDSARGADGATDVDGAAADGGACEKSCRGSLCFVSCDCGMAELNVNVECIDGCCAEEVDCDAECGGG